METKKPRPSKGLLAAQNHWVGKTVQCYIRDLKFKRRGPYTGTVKGLSTNQAEITDTGRPVYDATGLLVEIPELARHAIYGEYPIDFIDARIKNADARSENAEGETEQHANNDT